jgi:hypothetical protein
MATLEERMAAYDATLGQMNERLKDLQEGSCDITYPTTAWNRHFCPTLESPEATLQVIS